MIQHHCNAMRPLLVALSTLLLCACADAPKSTAGYYAGRVYITEETLPNTIQYTDLGEISVNQMWYTGAEELWGELAQKARERGANAVIKVEAFRAPSAFAWAAPHLEGRAIRVSDTAKLAATGLHFRES